MKTGNDLVVACTQEAPLFGELHGELKGSGTIQFVNIRETAGWSAEAASATPKIAALLALADVPEPEPVPVVSYQLGGRATDRRPGSAACCLGLSSLRASAAFPCCSPDMAHETAAELPAERRYPVWSGRVRAIRGYLGAFEVEWEQANPIDLEACTRCNACIHVCPEQAIDYSYQIDLDKCKAHRKCVAACGDIKAIDFERAETRRSERFDLVLDLTDRAAARCPSAAAGLLRTGRRRTGIGARGARARADVGGVRKAEIFRIQGKNLRPRPLRNRRVHALHRGLLDAGDHERARRKPRQGRAASLHGLRGVRSRVSFGRDDLRLSAGRRHGDAR